MTKSSEQRVSLNIKGMHCRSCEILLERAIGGVEGVKRVKAYFRPGRVDVTLDGELNLTSLEKAVTEAGYTVGKEDIQHFISHNSVDYLELAAAVAIVVVVYLALDTFGILQLSPGSGGVSGLAGVLLVGLTAGISTCMALIGGLVLGISSRHAELHPEASSLQKFRPHIFFNLGRLISYIVLGGLIGLVGSAFKLSSSFLGLFTILLGFVMLFLGLKLIDIFPRLHNASVTLPKQVSQFFGLHKDVREYSHSASFATGALTFFLPCGFTQAMQLYAVSTGSFVQGALIMGTFALGTLPGIISIGGFTSLIKGAFARYFFKVAGVVVIALALFNVNAGWNLAGLRISELVRFGQEDSTPPVRARIENGVQIVDMTQAANGYSPRKFIVEKGIPVVWNIQSTTSYTCAAYISMPSAGISQPLALGTNIIKFTPTSVGKMRFTCSMGMYSGTFEVID